VLKENRVDQRPIVTLQKLNASVARKSRICGL
jgi:hypothetical protein